MTRRPVTKPLDQLAHQLVWSAAELGAMLGRSPTDIYRHLTTDDDGNAWVEHCGRRIPGWANHNGNTRFIAAEVRAALNTDLVADT